MEAINHTFYDVENKFFLERDFGYHAQLAKATSPQELSSKLQEIIIDLGFSHFSFSNIECASTLQREINSFPEELLNQYHEEELFNQDMVLQRASNTNTPFFSSEVHDYIASAPFSSHMTRAMKNIYEIHKNYGFYDFFHIPYKTPNAYLLLSVASQGESPVDFKDKAKIAKRSLMLIMEATESIIQDRFESALPKKNSDTTINPKPLRVLNTLANNDLTIEQVANKLCISVVTANQHLKTVRLSLGVKTNYAAIKRALSKGLIQLDRTPGSNEPA